MHRNPAQPAYLAYRALNSALARARRQALDRGLSMDQWNAAVADYTTRLVARIMASRNIPEEDAARGFMAIYRQERARLHNAKKKAAN